MMASGTAALLAAAVPVGEPAQDPDSAGPGQDIGDQAHGAGRGEDGEHLAGPDDGSKPAGPGREWALDDVRG
jgi:hypothetical protein